MTLVCPCPVTSIGRVVADRYALPGSLDDHEDPWLGSWAFDLDRELVVVLMASQQDTCGAQHPVKTDLDEHIDTIYC